MANLLETIRRMEYPGRFIVAAGTQDGNALILYGITGRSESSRARRLITRGDGDVVKISIEVTDPEQLARGNPALLLYDALIISRNAVIIGNGVQTGLILDVLEKQTGSAASLEPEALLRKALAGTYPVTAQDRITIDITSFEPDPPIFTPRISALLAGNRIALSIIRRGVHGEAVKDFYSYTIEPGSGKLLSTYNGENPKNGPVPVFQGEPETITVPAFHSLPELTENVLESTGSFGVSIAGLIYPETIAIRNRK